MAAIRYSVLATALFLLADMGRACDPRVQQAMQFLLEQFPDALVRTDPVREIAFCPDNTCIRVRSSSQNQNLDGWLLAYLFHFGDYYALADWRAHVGSAEYLDGYPAALKDCLADEDPAACGKAAFGAANVTVVFTRADEGVVAETEALFNPPPSDPTAKP